MPSSWGADPPGHHARPRRSGRHRKGCRKGTAAAMLLVVAVAAGLIMATGIYVATVIY
jgi:hypothetical protein